MSSFATSLALKSAKARSPSSLEQKPSPGVMPSSWCNARIFSSVPVFCLLGWSWKKAGKATLAVLLEPLSNLYLESAKWFRNRSEPFWGVNTTSKPMNLLPGVLPKVLPKPESVLVLGGLGWGGGLSLRPGWLPGIAHSKTAD